MLHGIFEVLHHFWPKLMSFRPFSTKMAKHGLFTSLGIFREKRGEPDFLKKPRRNQTRQHYGYCLFYPRQAEHLCESSAFVILVTIHLDITFKISNNIYTKYYYAHLTTKIWRGKVVIG